ncbi:MAG TPA: ABC transporter ATP-binding protein, partial [Burkholderiales bacterium]|nr:ABC transporter ATP-binding protein [Burkholderiales bacterium]
LRLRLVNGALPKSLQSMLAAAQVSGEYVLALHDYTDVEGVLRAIRANGLEVAAMELQQPDLEEVFVGIMRRE